MVSLAQFKPLKFDPAQASEFLKVFSGKTLIVNRTKDDEFHLPRPVSDLYEFGNGWIEDNLHIHYIVNEATGRKDSDVVEIRAIWAEVDVVGPIREDWPLPPSIIVESSQGKYHYYWLTTPPGSPLEAKEEWKNVLLGMVDKYGADRGAVSLSRVLRVPGTYNFSSKYSTPQPVKLIKCSRTIYHWTEILKHFPPITEETSTYKEPVAAVSGEFNEQSHVLAFLSGDSISPSQTSLISHWGHHYSAAKIKVKLKQLYELVDPEIYRTNQSRYDYARDHNIEKEIKSIKEKIARNRQEESIKAIPITTKARPLSAENLVDFTPIPKDCVPEVVYNAANATNNYLGNGIEPSIIVALSSAGALLAKSVKIHEIGDTTTTYCSTGIVLAMPTGARKTQIFKILGKPVIEYEDILRKEWENSKNLTESKRFIIEQQIAYYDKEIKKVTAKGGGMNDLKGFMVSRANLMDDLDKLQLDMPSVYVQDTTEAAVIDVMSKNRGVISIYTDEGRNFVKNILGRFEKADSGGGSAEGWVTNGMGGMEIKTNRISAGETKISDPCLSILAMVQPDIATQFTDHSAYKNSGMAARLPVVHYPVDDIRMMENSDRKRRINEEPINKYYNMMRELYVRRFDNPLIVEISDIALDRLNAFNQRIVHLLKTDWNRDTNRTNKIITQAVILGTIIAATDDPEFRLKLQSDPAKRLSYTVGAKHINMGCIYAEALYEGMLKSHDSLDNLNIFRSAIAFAKSLLAKYESKAIYEGFINSSHLQNGFKMITKENRDGVIDMLKDHNWLLTTKCTERGMLNDGETKGMATPGEIIYHLNVDEVRKQLDLQEIEDKIENKHYTKGGFND